MRALTVVLCLVLSGCMADEQAASVAVPSAGASVAPERESRQAVRAPDPSVPAMSDVPRRPAPPSSRLIAKPSHTGALGTSSHVAGRVQGVASWYCGHGSACTRGYPGGLYAAAGPLLRVGKWRGRTVNVQSGDAIVRVTLIDWCACPNRVLDLYSTAFVRLAPLSRGLVKVTVSW